MYRSKISLLTYPSLGIALAMACGPQPIDVPDEDGDSDNGGTGASQGSGGSFGGTPANGGTFGGTPATGGFSGTPATGGFSGTPASGGTFAGTPATGGTFPTGGVSGAAVGGTAGAVATGGSSAGTPATGGSAGAGMLTCGAGFEVGTDGFVRSPGTTGCWNGYASAGGDVGTMVMPTTFAACGMGCMLRTSGMLGPANAANAYAGFAFLGFNVNQPIGTSTFSTIAPTGTSLVITYTKTAGPATIRVQLQGGATRWCANLMASPATIPYTMFNTACWDNTGTAYAKQPIDAVQLVAPGGETVQAIDITLVSVKDT
jgi:hypothetical protein